MGVMIQLRCQRCKARLFDGVDRLTTKQQATDEVIQAKCRNCGYVQRVYERAVAKEYEVS